jgi:aldose 1-epimerase
MCVARLGLLAAALLACAAAGAAGATSIRVDNFGRTRAGQQVGRVTLENALGMRFSCIDYGATITAIVVPGRRRKLASTGTNIVLGLPSLAAYEASTRRYGAVMGRYAGRIGNARFTLDGKPVALVPNAKGTALHGDPDGYDKRVWQRREFADAEAIGVIYHLLSPDGDQGFPGQVSVSVTYRLLRKRNELQVEYAASSDAATVINLTNHAYFNLAGAASGSLATHRFRIDAARYATVDAKRVPDGVLAPVAGTALDFRRGAALTPRLRASTLLGDPPGFDHTLVFADHGGALALVAQISDTGSGRRMQVRTTEPSVQLYSGNGFDGSETGAEGLAYPRYAGFAFETEHLPDSPNHPNFPSTRLAPGRPFHSLTTFRFGQSGRVRNTADR